MLAIADLKSKSSRELAALYSAADAGTPLEGDFSGVVLFPAISFLGRILGAIAPLIWRGKVFDSRKGTLLNRVGCLPVMLAMPGKFSVQKSWFDGKPSNVIEYPPTSWLFVIFRDELRELRPGLYLGRAHVKFAKSLALHFAIVK